MSFLKKFTPTDWLIVGSVCAVIGAMVYPSISLFSDVDNSKPIESYLLPSEISPDQIVQILITSRSQTDRGATEIACVLFNNGTSPIYYFGYTPDSFSPRMPSGRISPLYGMQARSVDQWEPTGPIGRCGTGIGRMRLLPGQAGQFIAYLKPGESDEAQVRVGVCYSSDPSSSSLDDEVIWSPSTRPPE